MSGQVSPERSPSAASPTDAITAADPNTLVDDDEFDTEDIASNASTSITSSILEHSVENGRRVRLAVSGLEYVLTFTGVPVSQIPQWPVSYSKRRYGTE